MPKLTRWMIKTSLLYLVLALVAGVLPPAARLLGITRLPGGLTPIYFHLFMVGWVTLLIFGVVFWMFPKFSRESPRGSEILGWATYWLLNAGLILRLAGEGYPAAWAWVLVPSAVFQWLAGLAFVVNTWPRVKEK